MNIWQKRSKELIEWWLVRDEFAEHVDQNESIDLNKVLAAFTEALEKLDELSVKNLED